MYKLVVTSLAENDLDEIISYIATELSAPIAATNFANAVAECYDRIILNPLCYEAARDPRLRLEGYRRAVIKNYIMLYKVFPKEEKVVVYRFFHCRRDYANLI
jgi:plasmid stabilization system protein ParE